MNQLVMTKYNPKGKDEGDIIIKERSEYLPESKIEQIVDAYGGNKDIENSLYNIEYLQQMDNEFHASGRYDSLSNWLTDNGYNSPKIPEAYGAIIHKDRDNEAAMWTIPSNNPILGTTPNLDSIISSYSHSEFDLSDHDMLEYALTHEYVHNSQSQTLLNKPTEFVEADVDLKLARYFHDLSKEDEKYSKFAKYAFNRYVNSVYAYIVNKGIKMSKEEFKELVEEHGIEEVMDILESRQKGERDYSEETEHQEEPEESDEAED